jgi:lipopolysaccharide biosynthesis protein
VQALAGDRAKLGQIAQGFAQDPGLGMVYPDPPRTLYPALRWTRNLRLAEQLAARLGLPDLPPDAGLDFPAGSMFWARQAALAPMLRAGLTAQHFAPEQGQEDGTLAHACERLLGVVCQSQGYHLARSPAR